MARAISHRRRETQSGFILLVIFLMAAMIAMMLYQQLPRVAFESERDKEQLLIERGEQYVRAIQLYYTDNQKWPQSIDELERTNNKRYLRKRYKDPYTGKEEWRLIHTNGNQLTDSLVQKQADPNKPSTSASSTSQQEGQQVNAAVNLRPSDVTLPGTQSFQGPLPGSQQDPNQTTPFPLTPSPNQGMNAPTSIPQSGPQNGPAGFGLPGQGLPQGVALPGGIQTSGAPGQQQGQQGQPGQNQQNGQGFTPQFPGQQFPGQAPPGGFQPQFAGQQFPGQLPPAGTQVQQTPQQNVPVGFQMGPNGQLIPAPVGANAGMPQVSVMGTPGTPALPGGVGNQGVNIIQQILTTPRTAPNAATTQQNNAVGGGGIAGVASMHEGPSIAVYKERQKYQEWEFIFTPGQNGAAGAIGGVGNQNTQGNQGKQNTTGSNNGLNNGFGNTGNGGGNSGFSNSGFGNSGFGNNGATSGRGGNTGGGAGAGGTLNPGGGGRGR